MALLSDYTAGTITVAANGTAVTGVGTAWLSAGFREGDLLFAAGYSGVILAVNSNTSITLDQPWKGGALAGSAYRMRYQGDGSRVSAQARQMIDLYGTSGNLAALGALVGAANKLPFFTGAGTMDLATLSAFVRTLLDEASAATFLATLGAGTKGIDVLAATTMVDLLAKLGPVFGGPAPAPSAAGVGLVDGDFNSIIVPGVYTIASTWANGWQGAAAATYTGILEVRARIFSNGYWQIFRQGRSVFRRYTSTPASWPAWEAIETPTLGVVSQSGGIPTGAIIERNSNANGDYVRFADGTQICSKLNLVATYDASFSITTTWTFPASFVASSVFSTVTTSNAGGDFVGLTRQDLGSVRQQNNGVASVNVGWAPVAGVSLTAGSQINNVRALAIGRWF